MVTGVSSMMITGNRMTSNSPTSGEAHANSDPQLNGISVIEPAKRSGDNRRSNKPIMEKRRRARINNCLNELKALILDATKKDPRHSKFEKADILEKTVKHLQDLQRQQSILTQATDPNVLNKFKAGFSECATEVSRFGGIDPVVKRRLLQHLSNCLTGVKTSTTSPESNLPVHILPSPPSSPEQSADKLMGGRHPVAMTATTPATAPAPGHKQQSSAFNHITLSSNGYFLSNGNGGVGVQLIPTKLTNGSIAFVVPPSGLQYPAQASAGAVQPQPNNNTPLPMLIPIPSRQPPVPSHSSGSSNPLPSNNNNNNSCSSSSSHGSLVRSTSTSPQHQFHNQSYDRRTPSSSYGSMDSQTMSPPSSPCQGPPYKRARSSTDNNHCDDDAEDRESECHSPEPLSLVLRKRRSSSSLGDEEADEVDKQCWRPW